MVSFSHADSPLLFETKYLKKQVDSCLGTILKMLKKKWLWYVSYYETLNELNVFFENNIYSEKNMHESLTKKLKKFSFSRANYRAHTPPPLNTTKIIKKVRFLAFFDLFIPARKSFSRGNYRAHPPPLCRSVSQTFVLTCL